MRDKLWNKKIPTLLGLLLIILGTGATSYLVSKGVIFVSKAGPSQIPQNIRISNISDNSFTVTYTTEDNVFGSVNYGETTQLSNTALDDRDQLTRNVTNHKIHSITVKNLTPSTDYFFSITSAENKYLNNNSPFKITTGDKIIASPSAQKPIAGKIITTSGNAPSEAIVLLTSGESQIASVLAKDDGTFLLPLNSLRNKDLTSYFSFPDMATIKILILADGAKSNVITSIGQTNPVPTITIGNDYNFTSSLTPVASNSGEVSNTTFPTFDTGQSVSIDPTITSPKKDQGVIDQQPVFKGTSLPGQNVQIEIHSDSAITTQVKSDAQGNWQYRPTTPLSPGNHTISITTKGANGILKTITQSFTVYASGTQVSQSATGSAKTTPTPTPTATPTAIPTPTLAPTPLPTASATASPAPTISSSPIATNTPLPTKTPLPPTGASTLPWAGIGIFVAFIGLTLFLLAKRGMIL